MSPKLEIVMEEDYNTATSDVKVTQLIDNHKQYGTHITPFIQDVEDTINYDSNNYCINPN